MANEANSETRRMTSSGWLEAKALTDFHASGPESGFPNGSVNVSRSIKRSYRFASCGTFAFESPINAPSRIISRIPSIGRETVSVVSHPSAVRVVRLVRTSSHAPVAIRFATDARRLL